METAKSPSLKLLIYIGIGVLGFGVVVFCFELPYTTSVNIASNGAAFFAFISFGSFLIYLGTK